MRAALLLQRCGGGGGAAEYAVLCAVGGRREECATIDAEEVRSSHNSEPLLALRNDL
jgi:hypothetical protein